MNRGGSRWLGPSITRAAGGLDATAVGRFRERSIQEPLMSACLGLVRASSHAVENPSTTAAVADID
jgi:hypothetical protein